ncbi:MAG: YwqG family protein [Oscillospiraceae bacterium]|nr:YwqG family protein [Oscillospiraceae bacterium]
MGTVTDEDNDYDYELMFGDCGHIYFWIRKSDLKNRDFDNIWLVLQCG